MWYGFWIHSFHEESFIYAALSIIINFTHNTDACMVLQTEVIPPIMDCFLVIKKPAFRIGKASIEKIFSLDAYISPIDRIRHTFSPSTDRCFFVHFCIVYNAFDIELRQDKFASSRVGFSHIHCGFLTHSGGLRGNRKDHCIVLRLLFRFCSQNEALICWQSALMTASFGGFTSPDSFSATSGSPSIW